MLLMRINITFSYFFSSELFKDISSQFDDIIISRKFIQWEEYRLNSFEVLDDPLELFVSWDLVEHPKGQNRIVSVCWKCSDALNEVSDYTLGYNLLAELRCPEKFS